MSKYPGRIVTDLAPAGYSVFFDGTGDFLTVTYPVNWSTYGSYTLEFWFYTTSIAANNYAFVSTGGTGYTNFYMYGSSGAYPGAIAVGIQGTNEIRSANSVIAANTWYHIAYTFDGTTTRIFVNGVLVASGTTAVYPNNSANLVIGNGLSNNFTLGNISNLRLVQGTALYTAAFTPPTQLLRVTNTQLLTCNSPAIVDQSTNNFTITANGNAAVSTLTPFTAYVPYNPALGASTPGIWTVDEAMQAAATRQWNMYDPSFPNTTLLLHGNPTNGTSFITDASTNNFTMTPNGTAQAANLSPFSLTTFATSGSGYFNGSTHIAAPANSAFSFPGDFTIEFWINPASLASDRSIFVIEASSGSNIFFALNATTTSLAVFLNSGSPSFTATPASNIQLNVWSHIAVVRNGSTVTVYVNGVAATGTGSSSATVGSSTTTFRIGGFATTTLNVCYISNFRVIKGTAVYTSNFTPSTSPLTAITNTSLLTLQNSQSANNNAFLDSSSNNFLITRNGNTTQGSFSPFSQTGWSNYIGGSANFLNLTTATIGTNSFTIEAWVYLNSNSNFSGIFSLLPNASGSGVSLVFQNTGILSGMVGNGNSALVISSPTAVAVSTWHHVAFVRSGTALTLYLNGVSVATGTSAANITQTSALIGRYYNDFNDYYLNGYISNLRVVNGAAVYTSNFTPPSTPLGATSGGQNPPTGTQTLVLTCQSNRFIDNSSNSYPISTSGAPSVQPFSPFYPTAAYTPQTIGGSAYFATTNDFLSYTPGAAQAFGTGDFTVECWIYTATSAANIMQSSSQTNSWGFLTFSNQLYWQWNSGNLFSGGTVQQNSWVHLAVSRTSGSTSGYVNGTRVFGGTANNDTNNYSGTPTRYIGPSGGGGVPFYVSGARIIKGTGLYSGASITVPTAPFTAVTNTAVLVNFTNAGVVDSTGKNALETVGNAQISTAVSRFGGSSMSFNGTNSYLRGQFGDLDFILGGGDWTIEAWVYLNSTAGTQGLIFGQSDFASFANASYEIYLTGSSANFYNGASNTTVTVPTIPATTWTHVAWVRNGTRITLYVNGTSSATSTISAAINNGTTNPPTIGATANGTFYVNGYIDELRITKGFARYTGNFTPQTSQWQDQ